MSPHAPRSPAAPRWLRPLAVLACVVALQLGMAVLSLDVLSAVRAYVGGESLYSKAQKDALLHLKSYLLDRSETDYQRFVQAMQVPLGDRAAREALQRSPPDLAAARQGFLQGGNDEADIDGVVRLFLVGQRLPMMADAIRTWTEGDRVIEQLMRQAAQAREHMRTGMPDDLSIRMHRLRILQTNERLTALEAEFSAQLGQAARQTRTVLLLLNLLLAAALALAGARYVRQTVAQQARKEAEIRAGRRTLRDILDSAEEGICGVDADGRCSFVNRSGMRLLGAGREEEWLGRPVQRLLGLQADPSRSEHGTAQLARPDGTVLTIEWWSHPTQDGSGSVVTFIDIGARMAAEQSLQQRALRQHLLAGYGRFALGMPEPSALAAQTLDVVARGLQARACAWFESRPPGHLQLAAGHGLDAATTALLQQAALATLQGDEVAVTAPLRAVVRGADGTHGVLAVACQPGASCDESAVEFLQTVAHTLAAAVERRTDRERLQRMAQLDALTGIPNRSLFLDRLGQTLIEAVRDGRPVAVLFIDIDRFKQVNDTLGHAAGDELLIAITHRIAACLRPGDSLGRLGGDEFTVALAHLADADDAARVAAKIVAAVARPFELGSHVAEVSASIGIAVYPADSADPETLLHQADLAMYQVKAAGRDGWRFFAAPESAPAP